MNYKRLNFIIYLIILSISSCYASFFTQRLESSSEDFLGNKPFKVRVLAENFPYIMKSSLKKSGVHPSQYFWNTMKVDIFFKKDKYSNRYWEGKLGNISFEQYHDPIDKRKILCIYCDINPKKRYYKRQLLSNTGKNILVDNYFDSKYKVEYWQNKGEWVVEDPDTLETQTFNLREKALRALKFYKEVPENLDIEPHIFNRPDILKEYYEKENPSIVSASFWKASFIGYLALSVPIIDALQGYYFIDENEEENEYASSLPSNQNLSESSIADPKPQYGTATNFMMPYIASTMILSLPHFNHYRHQLSLNLFFNMAATQLIGTPVRGENADSDMLFTYTANNFSTTATYENSFNTTEPHRFMESATFNHLKNSECSYLSAANKGNHKTSELRITLFPYIPDANKDKHETLVNHIKTEFGKIRSDIDLKLYMGHEAKDDPYTKDNLVKWLSSDGPERRDLVLLDTMLLSEVTDHIQPWDNLDTSDWHDVSRLAVTLKGKIYGVPHFLCSYFIFSNSQSIERVTSFEELTQLLEKVSASQIKLSADFTDSWTLPVLYLDSIKDQQVTSNLTSIVHGIVHREEVHPTAIEYLHNFLNFCRKNDKSPCEKEEGFKKGGPVEDFIAGYSYTNLGYFEDLHLLSSKNLDTQDFYFTSLPLGQGSNPLFFADAFVMRKGCNESCANNAKAFISFINQPDILSAIMLSQDVKNPTVAPRYLLPATKSAFESKGVKENPFYQKAKKVVEAGHPIPNDSLPQYKDKLHNKISTGIREVKEKNRTEKVK